MGVRCSSLQAHQHQMLPARLQRNALLGGQRQCRQRAHVRDIALPGHFVNFNAFGQGRRHACQPGRRRGPQREVKVCHFFVFLSGKAPRLR